MEKKITKTQNAKEIIDFIKANTMEEDTTAIRWIAYLENEIRIIGNKSKVTSAVQKQNEELKNLIYEYLQDKPDGKTITELTKVFDYSSQKISAICNQMTKEEPIPRLTKVIIKSKSFFKIYTPADDQEATEDEE